MNYINQFRGLPRQVYCICLARMIIGIGSMIFMFFSLLMTRILGFTEFQAGLGFLLMAVSSVGGAIVGGKLADHFGRKRIYMICIVLTSVLYALTSTVAGTRSMIPFIYLSSIIGSASYPILSAMVADSAPAEQRTECFSLLYLAQNLGFAFGPSIGGLLFYHHMDLLFLLQAAIFLAGGLFLQFTTTDVYALGVGKEFGIAPQTVDVTRPGRTLRENTFRMLFDRKPLFAFIFSLIFLTMCYQMIGFMLPLQMSDAFGMQDGSRYAGLIWTTNALCVVVGTPVIIGYTKKRHQLRTTALATVLYCVGFGFYAFVNTLPLFYVAVVIWTVGEIMISTGAGVFIAANAPATHRARFQSLYDMARSLGRGFGPPIFGLMLYKLSYQQAWLVDSLVCLIIGACLYAVYRWDAAAKRG
ncbi:MAG: MFS transporter [Eubacteriales bacterium]|nr:MFS transporter [Eubacteriales bacterium]